MKKIIIVSNRLPLKVEKNEKSIVFTPTSGGLATGLKSIHESDNALWIGWPGVSKEELNETQVDQIQKSLREMNFKPVHLDNEQVENFYLGLSNKSIWPLFHYFKQNVVFDENQWNAYVQVNEQFAQAIIEEIKPGDTLWVHDYQLMLVPKLIRQKVPDVTIGFFLHIPFPSFEIFRIFPKRREILSGLIGADLIGFHTYDYERHFLSSVKRILHLEVNFNTINNKGREVVVNTFPMGIDFEKFQAVSKTHSEINKSQYGEIRKQLSSHREHTNGKLILSIDRLDYTKGILNRIEAFEIFLQRFPEYHEKIRLVMVIVPSRSEVSHYKQLKKKTDESIGRVNGLFSTVNWTPIWYYYRSFEFNDLIDLYRECEIGMVTPLRDGMNLVAKEFLATKIDSKGILILSELAGASKELHHALLVNPFDTLSLSDAIHEAINMSDAEQVERNKPMRERIRRYDIHEWSKRFMKELGAIPERVSEDQTVKIKSKEQNTILQSFNLAKNRLLLLDYDGTLTGFHVNHKKAIPSEKLLKTIKVLSENNSTNVVIISGRSSDFLEKYFGHLYIDLIAEHGHLIRTKGTSKWKEKNISSNDWMPHILPIMQQFADNTPGTFVEIKKNSLVWHYRKTDPELGIIKSEELKTILSSMISNEVHLMNGDKIIEIVSSSVNKGTAAVERLDSSNYDFILAAGDDITDEDMFHYLPPRAINIKVGLKDTVAKYRIVDPIAMVDFLEQLTHSF
ncbi:MAG: bifunctional alpha,alpha-trehalose-phosphate synthase (UDP-forming)/trehalose-phosphatase [Flavobacteriaceae bacterium]